MMDNVTDSTVNGNNTPPSKPQAGSAGQPKRQGKKTLWLCIVGGAVLLAVLALFLIFIFAPASTSGTDVDSDAGLSPLIYKSDGAIYLAAGGQSIKLDGAAGDYGFRGEASADGNSLYYLANLNSSFKGDLMRIALGVKNAVPERIAKDVYSAKISPDGKNILYISNANSYDINGALYLCEPKGEPVLIAQYVSGLNYGFSSDGSYVYYCTYDADTHIQKLYLYSSGESKEIFENNDGNGLSVYVDKDGRALIAAGDFGFVEKLDYAVYVYDGSEAKRIAEHAVFVRSLGSADEVVYVTQDNELIYYDGANKQVISDKTSGLKFTDNMWFSMTGDRFVFAEGGEDINSSVLYEFTVHDGKAVIGHTSLRYFANTDFSRVAYYTQDGLYIASKENGKWNETKIAGRGGEPQFDSDGKYIYYTSSSDNTLEKNTLYRMSLSGGETETLLTGTEKFLLWNNECYVLSTEGDLYRITGVNDCVLLQEGFAEEHFHVTPIHLSGLIAAKEGVYAFNYKDNSYPVFSDIYYISGSKSERVCGEVEYLECSGLMPLIVY